MTYPLALYRDGDHFEWDGRPTDMLSVANEDEHLAAADKGWMEAGEYLAGPKSSPDDNEGAVKRAPGRPKKEVA